MNVKTQRTLGQLLTYTLLLAGAGIVAVPFWYMVATSLKPQSYIFEIPPRLWPHPATLTNYTTALGKDL